MIALNRLSRAKQTITLTGGAEVTVRFDGGDFDGTPIYKVKLDGCTWREIIAVGLALSPEDVNSLDALREAYKVDADGEEA